MWSNFKQAWRQCLTDTIGYLGNMFSHFGALMSGGFKKELDVGCRQCLFPFPPIEKTTRQYGVNQMVFWG